MGTPVDTELPDTKGFCGCGHQPPAVVDAHSEALGEGLGCPCGCVASSKMLSLPGPQFGCLCCGITGRLPQRGSGTPPSSSEQLARCSSWGVLKLHGTLPPPAGCLQAC